MSIMNADEEETLFELRFRPTVALASTVRRFVAEFYREILRDADHSNRLAMATHEMLENAVHYSIDQRSELCIEARTTTESLIVTIRTRNRATTERLAKVRVALDEVLNADDASTMYTRLLHRAAKRTDGGSGLGLGRIRAEADLALSYAIEGDTIAVTAEGQFPRAPSAQLTDAS